METKVPDVYRAICEVTRVIGKDGIAKDKQNTQPNAGYKFRGIDDVYNALNAVLAGAGLCILPRMTDRTVDERASKSGGVIFSVVVRAEFDFVAVKDGSLHTVMMYGEAMDSGDKATNKAMSAAYKYACMQVFCIPTEGLVEDADATTHQPIPKSAPVAPKPPAPPPPTKPRPQPVPGKTTEPSPREVITDTATKMLDKFQAINQGPLFFKTLGTSGYESIADIPADYNIARPIIEDLKMALADCKRSN